MLEIRKDFPNVRYFLSCDDEATRATIGAAVPGVLSITKPGGFNTSQGVQDAVVDLYLLAASAYLVGPHWSSFMDMATLLGGSTLRSETSVSPRNLEGAIPLQRMVSDPTQPWRA
jgi:hypothetical protein